MILNLSLVFNFFDLGLVAKFNHIHLGHVMAIITEKFIYILY